MKTILIIEDNKDIREGTAEILTLAGYNALEAENGRKGFELARQHKPALILCDVMMPELDGFGVLYLLSKHQETANIPFIFLTAKADRVDLRRGMDMGADDYLTKPFDESELLNAIDSRLAKERRRQDYFQLAMRNLEPLTRNGKGTAALKEMAAGRKIRQVHKKQILFYEGDQPQGLYLVLDGAVRTYKLATDGRQLVMNVYLPNQYVGIHALFSDDLYTETAEAVEDTTICMLPKDAVDNLINRYPDLGHRFIRLLADNIREKEDLLIELAYQSVRKRLAQTLVRLSEGQFAGQSDLHISRDALAAMAGMAVETVSRTLSDFRDEKLIDKDGVSVRIIDGERLRKMKS